MVLGTSSPEYRFLQILVSTYVATWTSMLNAICISQPRIYQNCTQPLDPTYSMPSLPTASDLYQGGQTYYYGPYVAVQFPGFSSTLFQAYRTNLTAAAVSVLTAACAANSTCTTAYRSTAKAANITLALVNTNFNSIQYVLAHNPTQQWVPNEYYGITGRRYTSSPTSGDQVYGMHDAVLRGVSAGKINATLYLNQLELGKLFVSGFSMYEGIIHTLALGSYDRVGHVQSNINMTAPQLYTHITPGGYGLEARGVSAANYTSKWQVWRDEADGVRVDEAVVFAEMEQAARKRSFAAATRAQTRMNAFAQAKDTCDNDAALQVGIEAFDLLDKACIAESFISITGNLNKVVKSAEMVAASRGIPAGLKSAGMSFHKVLIAETSMICAMDGAVCFPGQDVWKLASVGLSAYGLAMTLLEAGTPLGLTIAAADLLCALAPIAADAYKKDHACCLSDCKSAACQTSVRGCSEFAAPGYC